jgi:hypothetical protein
MTLRDRIRRWHSPTVFALIALCFLLPFMTVFANGCDTNLHSTTTFTGVQLVTHTVPSGGRDPSCGQDISVCVERAGATTADVAFGAAIVGLILGLLGIARGPGWCASLGLGSLVVLFGKLGNLSTDDFSLHAGYWLALLLFLWAGLVHLRRAAKRRRAPARPTRPLLWGPPPISPPPPQGGHHV